MRSSSRRSTASHAARDRLVQRGGAHDGVVALRVEAGREQREQVVGDRRVRHQHVEPVGDGVAGIDLAAVPNQARSRSTSDQSSPAWTTRRLRPSTSVRPVHWASTASATRSASAVEVEVVAVGPPQPHVVDVPALLVLSEASSAARRRSRGRGSRAPATDGTARGRRGLSRRSGRPDRPVPSTGEKRIRISGAPAAPAPSTSSSSQQVAAASAARSPRGKGPAAASPSGSAARRRRRRSGRRSSARRRSVHAVRFVPSTSRSGTDLTLRSEPGSGGQPHARRPLSSPEPLRRNDMKSLENDVDDL